MKHRKLRIAWSVGWGVATVMLVALWVRSYRWSDDLRIPVSRSHVLRFDSLRGGLNCEWWDTSESPHLNCWKLLSNKMDPDDDWRTFDQKTQKWALGSYGDGSARFVDFPHWFAIVLCVSFSAIAWVSWQFSLRTLLIVATVVAVGLGLIMWLNAGVSEETVERTAVQKVAVRELIDPTSLTGNAHAEKEGWLVLVHPVDETSPKGWIVTVNHEGKVVHIEASI